jgi:nicotinate-nucleotide adenylyltransferase
LRLGLLGGTFDPIHNGHLALADAAVACARLDRVLLIPSNQPPHRAPAQASVEDRLAMCRLAAEGHPELEVSDVEARRSGQSYTLETLQEVRRERPRDSLFLILGWDAARELASWHRPAEVLALAKPVIVNRPGLQPPGEMELRTAGLDPDRTLVCPQRTPDTRATEVRELAARGAELDRLVPPPVAEYIRKRGLYRWAGR